MKYQYKHATLFAEETTVGFQLTAGIAAGAFGVMLMLQSFTAYYSAAATLNPLYLLGGVVLSTIGYTLISLVSESLTDEER
jgi:hypothetical protein